MTTEVDPVELEIMRRQLEGIAEEMGRTLIRGAYSPNIKERRDASTALFDPAGRLIAQAEHIPVHLGAMPDAVAAVIESQRSVGPTYLVNDPYHGGSHLPDVTVVGPLLVDDRHLGYGAVRAHWADIGGAVPGGLAGGARTIFEEGVVIPPIPIADGDRRHTETIDLILSNIRNPDLRRADLEAQLGAITLARRRIGELAEEYGSTHLETAYDAVIGYARRRTERAIEGLPDGTYHAIDYLEGDGVTDAAIGIAVEVTIEGASIGVDFTGTESQVAGNVNAPPAVAKSAVYFVVRCLTDPDTPSNHGCYEPIEITIPPGTLLDPEPPAAVGGGNVETSQRVVDVLLAALGDADIDLPAHGQGTMNNLVIGFNDGSTYYETIGGGAGATASADGTDGIHVGMTNTRNTPVEALERAYPLIVRRYGLRPGSGGAGTQRGGMGIERALELGEDATISMLSDRRRRGPPGIRGGAAGAVGENHIDNDELGSKATVSVGSGVIVRVLTPGGGGVGPPDRRTSSAIERDRRDGKVEEERSP